MSAQLLKTKFFIPKPPIHTVSRPGLQERLDRALDCKLTLLAAPAGFGKTTLMSCWIQEQSPNAAWISLDGDDNDATQFWAYVTRALQQVCVNWKVSLLPEFNPIQPPPTQTLLTHLINQLTDIDQQMVLVLDDYHVISNQDIHRDLAFLIDHLPPHLHIILATRADPPIPISKLRAQARLNEIRVDDLRFSLDEATALLNQILELNLSQNDIQVLESRTEGWAAGLQLAALSLHRQPDKQKFIKDLSGSHHFILEYLTEEVLNHLPKDLLAFMLQTSVLEQFNPQLCDTLIEGKDSYNQIAELRKQHLFIVPLDAERNWFRYHHLFRDLLNNRLKREYPPEHVAELYKRASQWHQGTNQYDQAVKYALLARDFSLAADLIEAAAGGNMLHGRLTTLLGWLDSLPRSILDARPRLRFYQAWALSLSGQPMLAEQLLLETRSTLNSLPKSLENTALRGELAALLTGIITYYNDPERVLQEANEALTYLPEEDLISRARVHIALVTAYAYLDEPEKAAQMCELARDLALEADNPFLATAAMELLAGMHIFHRGQLHTGMRILEHIFDLGSKQDGSLHTFTGTAHNLAAEVYLEWNQLDQARRYLNTGFELIERGGIGYSLSHAYCAKARLMHRLGDQDAAINTLRSAEEAVMKTPMLHIIVHYLACQVRISLWRGDLETASDLILGEQSPLYRELPGELPTYIDEVLQISSAWVHLAQNQHEKVLQIGQGLLIQARSGGRTAHVIEVLLLEALAFQQQGKILQALESLDRCLSLAEPEGYRHLFMSAGQQTYNLLLTAKDRNIHPAYVKQLLSDFDTYSDSLNVQQTPQKKQQALIEPLSQRELQVLSLIIEGLTNQEIADELVVSLNTVKKHTTHIYGKLGVKNRAQAIAISKQLNLNQ